jgi:hypothetical protein
MKGALLTPAGFRKRCNERAMHRFAGVLRACKNAREIK